MDKNKKPEVHKDLKGFDISIDPFGNVSSNIDMKEIKEFLDEHVDDKKLRSSGEEE